MIPGTAVPRPPLLGLHRLRVAAVIAVLWALLMSAGSQAPFYLILARTGFVTLCVLLVFGLLERWPRRPPRWVARWAMQVVGVAAAVPPLAFLAYVLTTMGDPEPFWRNELRRTGLMHLIFSGILFGPWITVAALLRQRDVIVRDQALAFEQERGAYERRVSEARLRLLQAQVQPHFLFNTLANVRELVDSGSPQASQVLGSLIAYLRAAVPRLEEPATTVGQELELVRAYLDIMHMRMPDRLQFVVQADEAALPLRCPPMTLLTLVENAVRHGIDPSEEGGRIDVRVLVRDGRCRAQVSDTGVGLEGAGGGLGTGLSTLRERLDLAFGGRARLHLTPLEPAGVCAELDFPAERAAA